jgi:uncharacterized membrane protein
VFISDKSGANAIFLRVCIVTTMRPKMQQSLFWIALAICGGVALATRWLSLGQESLWFDEGMTWWLASLSPARMLQVIRGDVAAPAYFLLLHGWEALFGDSASAMRALSALAATIALVPFYLLARSILLARSAQIAACAMMAVSFMQIQYAKEARYYALLSLLLIAALWCVTRLADRWSWPAAAGLVICAALGLYTHNMMFFGLVGVWGAWLVWPGDRTLGRRLIDLLLVTIVTGLIYLPWIPALLQQMKWMTGTFWASRPDGTALRLATSAIAGVDVYAPPEFAWAWLHQPVLSAEGVGRIVAAAVALGCVLAIVARSSRVRRMAWGLAIFTLGPVLLVFLYSQWRQPIFMERVFIASSATMPIILAMALDEGRGKFLRTCGWILFAGIFGLGLLSTGSLLNGDRKEDWRTAYATVAKLEPSDRRLIVFVANEGELPFAYYASHDPSRPAEVRTGAPAGFFDLDPPKTIRRVLASSDLDSLRGQMASGKWDEIVLVLSHEWFSDPGNLTEQYLRRHWTLVEQAHLRLVRVLRFDSPEK